MKLMEVQFQAWLRGTGVTCYNLTMHQKHALSIIYPLDQLPSYARDLPQIGKSLYDHQHTRNLKTVHLSLEVAHMHLQMKHHDGKYNMDPLCMGPKQQEQSQKKLEVSK
jgi:hypothetical protein